MPPPGNFKFSSPPVFKVLHQGIVFFLPFAFSSTAALALIQANIPVVSGQAISV